MSVRLEYGNHSLDWQIYHNQTLVNWGRDNIKQSTKYSFPSPSFWGPFIAMNGSVRTDTWQSLNDWLPNNQNVFCWFFLTAECRVGHDSILKFDRLKGAILHRSSNLQVSLEALTLLENAKVHKDCFLVARSMVIYSQIYSKRSQILRNDCNCKGSVINQHKIWVRGVIWCIYNSQFPIPNSLLQTKIKVKVWWKSVTLSRWNKNPIFNEGSIVMNGKALSETFYFWPWVAKLYFLKVKWISTIRGVIKTKNGKISEILESWLHFWSLKDAFCPNKCGIIVAFRRKVIDFLSSNCGYRIYCNSND